MPNRMIKESMLSSDKIASLSDFEFRLWIGLILSADDMGRGDARAAIIKGRVFPLLGQVSPENVEDALHALAAKGCISFYTAGGKPYFWFPTWSEHQRIRNIKPKYPDPQVASEPDTGLQAAPRSASGCNGAPSKKGALPAERQRAQGAARGNLRQTAAVCGLKPGQAQEESKLKPEPEGEAGPVNEPGPEGEPASESIPETEEGPPGRKDPVTGAVVKAVGELSPRASAELEGFVRDMGEACIRRALDVARDAGKPTWAYVRGILRRKREQGVTSDRDWDRLEQQWEQGKQSIAGVPRCVQPDPERARKNSQWLDRFLEGEREA